MSIHHHFLSDIDASLLHHDLSLATRRLMDLGEEFRIDADTREQIIALRREFLGAETKEHKNQLNQELVERTSNLTALLRQQDLLPVNGTPPEEDYILKAEGISKTFTRGRQPFKLEALNVLLKAGEITGVVGENGNGKTTLLRLLCGELSVDSGTLHYPGLTSETDWYSVKNKLAFIPQRIDKWHGTLLDNLKFYASIHGFTGAANEERINYILYRLGLDKFRDLKWSEISSGYRLRFELAKMLLWKPRLLLLDEPLANLDINAQQLFLQDLRFFSRSSAHPMGIILTSQNLHEIERVADNIIFIRQGKTIYNGQQQDFANDREQNSFEIAGKFDLDTLLHCFSEHKDLSIENSGTSFIISGDKSHTIYTIMKLLEQKNMELSYIRDISQSTRKLFHKDI